jgi:hypothetical protein
MVTRKFYKVVRVDASGRMVDVYSGKLVYAVGEVTIDPSDHGLSVHTTELRAVNHPVPDVSVGFDWPAKLIEVEVEEGDILNPDDIKSGEKILVSKLRTIRVVRDLDCRVVQKGYSPYRMRDAERWLNEGWAAFEVVDCIRRGSFDPYLISAEHRRCYVIECRPARSGRWAKPVVYRAWPHGWCLDVAPFYCCQVTGRKIFVHDVRNFCGLP